MAMNTRTAKPPREALSGSVERVTFHAEETGFCVLRVKVRGTRDPVTVVGHAGAISAGEFVQASGAWNNDRQHGLQFKAEFLRSVPPTTAEGIERYLGSGMIKGIGPVNAKRMVAAFGERTLDVIEETPERLRDIGGIGPKRAAGIVAGWAEQKVIREIMLALHGWGVSTSRAVRIYKTYASDAVAVIVDNPYRLARDIRGIGFLTADRIAEKVGIEKTSMKRVRAGISHALAEAMSEGHCGLPVHDLQDLACKLLEVDGELVNQATALELADGSVVEDNVRKERCVFLAGLHAAEAQIAARLHTLADGNPPWPAVNTAKAIGWVEAKTGLTLAPSQRDALELAVRSKATVITGGPGVGKTTLVNSILKVLTAKGVSVSLCAPTGRAAKRLSESTGMEALTVHRLLETDPKNGGFRRNDANPLSCDLLVVDESSMLDVMLARSLLRALPDHAGLLMVGDVDQLPSVGPGRVLADIIESGAVPVVRLTEVFRQAADSRIVASAHAINRGRMPDLTRPADGSLTDFYFIEESEPEEAVRKIIATIRERIPASFGFDPVRDVQVLCPMQRGALGARALNAALQEALNPGRTETVERFGWTYSPGDKVMQVENDYDRSVYNGDLGIVTGVDTEQSDLTAEIDGREVSYGFSDLDELSLAYATSIHKSQGSEYPVVVMPITMSHYNMLSRPLIYTGVTRAKKLLVMVGERRALGIAVRNASAGKRWTRLGEVLMERGTDSVPATAAAP
jgi:exodeoxyribonuclease V alpha subunit